jgi:hypothetical protein
VRKVGIANTGHSQARKHPISKHALDQVIDQSLENNYLVQRKEKSQDGDKQKTLSAHLPFLGTSPGPPSMRRSTS